MSEDSDSEKETKKETKKPTKKVAKEESSEDSDAVKKIINTKKPGKKEPVKEKSESEASEEEEKPKPKSKVAKKEEPQETKEVDDGETHAELFVKNMSWTTTEDTLAEYMGQFGTVVSVKILKDRETGKPKGIGFVAFASRSEAKKAMEGPGELDERTINCSWSNQKGERTGGPGGPGGFKGGNDGGFQKKSYSGTAYTIFVGNLGFKTPDNEVKKFFSQAGNVVDVRIALNEEGKRKGFCHVDFDSEEAVQKAMALTNTELDGRALRVDASTPKGQGGSRGGFGGGRGGFGGGRGGNRGGSGRPMQGRFGENQGKKTTFDDNDD